MPDKQEALSIKESVLALSKMPCLTPEDYPRDYGHTANCQCKGTGKRFPQLQEYVKACEVPWGDTLDQISTAHPILCACGGTGHIVTEPPIQVALEIARVAFFPDISAEWNATYKPWKHMSCPPELYWNAVLEEAEEEQQGQHDAEELDRLTDGKSREW